jgi:ABC-type sugar transport system ATPase subunit
MMVGRKLSQLYHKTNVPSDNIVLKVENLINNRIDDVSFSVHEGEVFGLGGMVGAGRSEIIRAIFGADEISSQGKIFINGTKLKNNTPIKSIKHGIGYVPEDRKIQSLLLKKDSNYNISLAYLDLINKGVFVNTDKLQKESQRQIDSLKIKIINKNSEVAELSGGNQQKIVIGKWLINNKLKVLLLDEPTRGVDVGVKAQIYKLIDELANNGVAIVLVTSELPELIGLSDRIAVIKDGSITGILNKDEFSQEKIMYLCV